jgi:hypothetical protein
MYSFYTICRGSVNAGLYSSFLKAMDGKKQRYSVGLEKGVMRGVSEMID